MLTVYVINITSYASRQDVCIDIQYDGSICQHYACIASYTVNRASECIISLFIY